MNLASNDLPAIYSHEIPPICLRPLLDPRFGLSARLVHDPAGLVRSLLASI